MISIGDLMGNNAFAAQPTIPKTDLSAHVDGGQSGANTGSTVSADAESVLWGGVAVVGGAIALLWFFGAFAFRGLPSL